MTRGPVFAVEGGDRLRATMTAAGAKLADLTRVHRRTAAKVAATALPATPVRSGALAATVRPGASKTTAMVRAGAGAVVYAPVIHFGWPAHHIPAQPWILTAAQSTQDEWTGYYEDEIDKILNTIHGAS